MLTYHTCVTGMAEDNAYIWDVLHPLRPRFSVGFRGQSMVPSPRLQERTT